MTRQPEAVRAGRWLNANVVGGAAMAGGNILLVVNDTLVKLAAGQLPMSEVIALRAAVAIAVLLALLRLTSAGSEPWPRLSPALGWRAVFEVAVSFSYLYALQVLPIADLAGLTQIVPVLILAGAALVFREAIGWHGWAATLVGLVGALLIIKPGAADPAVRISVAGLVLAAMAVIFHVVRDLQTRALPAHLPPTFVAATSQGAMLVTALTLAPFDGWSVPTVPMALQIAAAAAFLGVANAWLVTAMRTGAIAVVGTFRYAGLMAALVSGWLVWGEFPDQLALAGSAIIALSGLASLWFGARTR
jgi:drug/metabolite transporter (DMT)-like permease